MSHQVQRNTQPYRLGRLARFDHRTGTNAARCDAVVLAGEPVELALCDCEFATGPPNGLSCEKEGWFVSSFEREGSWVGPHMLSLPASTCLGCPSPQLDATLALQQPQPQPMHSTQLNLGLSAADQRRRAGAPFQGKVL